MAPMEMTRFDVAAFIVSNKKERKEDVQPGEVRGPGREWRGRW